MPSKKDNIIYEKGTEYKIKDKVFELIITPLEIKEKVVELSGWLNEKFKAETPVLIPVLTGSFLLTGDLLPLLEFRYDMNFIKVSSYGSEMESGGIIQEVIGLNMSLEGRSVIVIEDIIDTGLTVDYIVEKLKSAGAKEVLLITLIFKRTNWTGTEYPDWIGFELDDRFVVGYGMDYGEQGRSLRAIYALKTFI